MRKAYPTLLAAAVLFVWTWPAAAHPSSSPQTKPRPEDTEVWKPVPEKVAPGPVPLHGATVYIGQPQYTPHGATPITLQSHNDPSEPLGFRNIWVRELPDM